MPGGESLTHSKVHILGTSDNDTREKIDIWMDGYIKGRDY